ncbi:hypothetical protein AB833_12455 [Chromatiales bacterium (ex Bugula neritina AB1)]|nr:hypothetical protein AB833_12455 [Chromatiales bacterium (ex Bugula neritina AB1)]
MLELVRVPSAAARRASVVDNDLRIQSRRMMQGYVVALVVVTAVIAFSYVALQRTLSEQATLSRSFVVISDMQRAIRDSSVRIDDLKEVLSSDEVNEQLLQKIQASLAMDMQQIGDLHTEAGYLVGALGERSSSAAVEAMFLEPPYSLNSRVEQYQDRMSELVTMLLEPSSDSKTTWLPIDAAAGDQGVLEKGYREVFNAIQVEMTENTDHVHTYHSTLSALIILVLVLVTLLIFIPLVAAFRRVQTRVVNAQLELSNRAFFDAATGLPNAAGLDDLLCDREMDSVADGPQYLSLLVIRIQNFTVISKLIGLRETDSFFLGFSERLKEYFPEDTDIARTGDEEFTIMLETEHLQSLVDNRDALHKALDSKITVGNIQVFPVTVLGASIASGNPVSFMNQLLNARLASQKYCVTETTIPLFDTSMSNEVENENALIEEIRSGIANSEFVPYYQIQVESVGGKPVGMEALCRWHRGDGTVVSPAEFIPVAEKSGLIVGLTWLLLEKMVVDYKNWLAQGLRPGRVAFNVAALALIDSEFIERLSRANDAIDSPTPVFEVEITENIALSDTSQHAIDVLTKVRELGVKLALDDFGTGYASLSSLLEVSVDVVKIDQSFVKEMEHNSVNRGVVEAVISMCKTMEMECVAEGVETQQQAKVLRELGCEILQGYYFYKPAQAAAVGEMLFTSQRIRKAM